MNTFKTKLNRPQKTATTNGMKAYTKSVNPILDLFYQAGGMRGQDIRALFSAAYRENPDLALRCALYIRDVREGMGERDLFRQLLTGFDEMSQVLHRVPSLGRWDDLLFARDSETAYRLIQRGLEEKNSLCAKWMPRKGEHAAMLRNFLGLGPKAYRKLLVHLTDVVEQKMCAKMWQKINYSHVPSQAVRIYRRAFYKNDQKRFAEFVEAAKRGEVKINAAATHPHEILMPLVQKAPTRLEKNAIEAQWAALPNWCREGQGILPLIDVSGSMSAPLGGSSSTYCMTAAVALGLYIAERQQGDFKNIVMTFHSNPRLYEIQGSIEERVRQTLAMPWGGSTNIERAAVNIVQFAKKHAIHDKDMPKMLVVLSDMQFDAADKNKNAAQMFRKTFENAGYSVPQIVFWNLRSPVDKTAPVKKDKDGVAMVSGFSPAIMKAVIEASLEQFSPMSVMMQKLSSARYNYK